MPDYFPTMRIPVLSGRSIDASDIRGSNPVVMVNAALARRFYGDDGARAAIGKRIKWGTAQNGAPWLTIIGVAADVKDVGLDKKQEWSIYFPALQAADANLNGMMRSFAFVARSNGDDGVVLREVRQAVRRIDPTMPIVGPNRMAELVATSLGDRRFNTYAIGAFAILALSLAAVGIYGLVAYLVVQRSREIGLRLALGAVPRDVLRMVIGQGAALAGTGIVVGLIATAAMARVFRSMLFGVGPFDVTSFVAAATLLFAVAIAASLIPAWRAAKMDPQATLRD
jgi:ABC-type antimicrobial peptide transport system permease subunit